MNVYSVSNGDSFGVPLLYEDDQALKKALTQMFSDLLDLDEDNQVRDAILKTKVFQIGTFKPEKGVLRPCFHRLAFDCSILLEVTHV